MTHAEISRGRRKVDSDPCPRTGTEGCEQSWGILDTGQGRTTPAAHSRRTPVWDRTVGARHLGRATVPEGALQGSRGAGRTRPLPEAPPTWDPHQHPWCQDLAGSHSGSRGACFTGQSRAWALNEQELPPPHHRLTGPWPSDPHPGCISHLPRVAEFQIHWTWSVPGHHTPPCKCPDLLPSACKP